MGFRLGQIDNVGDLSHVGFPEWFTQKEKNHEHFLSTLDDCPLRYRIKGEDFYRILFFRRGSAVYYSEGTINYNKDDVHREIIDKPD